jgi:hypothetical protein
MTKAFDKTLMIGRMGSGGVNQFGYKAYQTAAGASNPSPVTDNNEMPWNLTLSAAITGTNNKFWPIDDSYSHYLFAYDGTDQRMYALTETPSWLNKVPIIGGIAKVLGVSGDHKLHY